VETMILYAATLAAFVANEAANTPISTMSCQDPLWARLIIASIPSILALGIAWMAFRWNSQKDHKRWVLDNKKIEWQRMLTLASAVEKFMPSVAPGSETIEAVHDHDFDQHLCDATRAALECVFISQAKSEAIYTKLVSIRSSNEVAKGHIEDYQVDANQAHLLGKPRPLIAAQNVRFELVSLWRDVRRFATEDLRVE
jgi:hypothetical protein